MKKREWNENKMREGEEKVGIEMMRTRMGRQKIDRRGEGREK